MIAFSFLLVTILISISFDDESFWSKTLSLLVAKHCLDLVSYTVDLMAFTLRRVSLLKYRFILDFISICLIIAV